MLWIKFLEFKPSYTCICYSAFLFCVWLDNWLFISCKLCIHAALLSFSGVFLYTHCKIIRFFFPWNIIDHYLFLPRAHAQGVKWSTVLDCCLKSPSRERVLLWKQSYINNCIFGNRITGFDSLRVLPFCYPPQRYSPRPQGITRVHHTSYINMSRPWVRVNTLAGGVYMCALALQSSSW